MTGSEDLNKRNAVERPLLDEVRAWLRQQGQHLEFRVAEEFAVRGFGVKQGGHILAADGKSREVDVLGYRAVAGENLVAGVAVLVECKYSKGKPWVVLSNPYGVPDDEDVLKASLGSTLWHRLAPHVPSAAPELLGGPLLVQTPRHAFGGRQAFGTKDDVVYGALQGVVAKARDATREVNIPDEGGMHHVWIVLPTIVVEAPVVEAHWCPEKQDLVLEQVDGIRLHWSGSSGSDDDVAVDIVSADGLGEHLDRLVASLEPSLQRIHALASQLLAQASVSEAAVPP